MLLLLVSWAGSDVRAAAPPPQAVRVTTADTSERISLPSIRGTYRLDVDALAQKIRLTPSSGGVDGVFTRIKTHLGAVCPNGRVVNGAIELTCRTRRFDAQVTTKAGGTYLDINELRGLPWRPGPDAPVSYHFEPWRSGLGQTCPAISGAARGECLLKEGHVLEAAMHFRSALESIGRQAACVRLGDMALGIGDPNVAMGWYLRAGTVGPFGRIAMSRICELNGECLETTESLLETFDPTGLPEPLRAEIMMRSVRAEVYMGRSEAAIDMLFKQTRAQGLPSVCRDNGEPMCRKVILTALVEAGAKTAERTAADTAHDDDLVELYLSLPTWEKGPLAVELGQAAAPIIARLGAPMFAGNLLSVLAPEVPVSMLSDHLVLSAEIFIQGQNWARAELVVEYAQTRLDKKAMATPRWAKIMRTVMGTGDRHEISPATRGAIEAELAATLEALKETRRVTAKMHAILNGVSEGQEPESPGAPSRTAARGKEEGP